MNARPVLGGIGGLTVWEYLNLAFSGLPSCYEFDVTAKNDGV